MAHAQSAPLPVKVTVPAHVEWCARSQPIDIAKNDDPDIGALTFQILYMRIENAALDADLTSIGVPYFASVKDVAPPKSVTAAPAAPASRAVEEEIPAPIALKTFTVCAIVPPTVNAPGSGVVARMIAERSVYAVRCEAAADEECRKRITDTMAAAGIDVDKLGDHSWSIRQALSNANDTAALVADLSDHSLRMLHKGEPIIAPSGFVTVAAEIP